MNNFVEQLVKLHNEDETACLETRKEIVDYFFKSSPESVRDMLYDEFNSLDKDIGESIEQEKKNT
ncbi:MAG: hypothetical protein K2J68_04435 [Treponemataceae bacterium]|nr:hypothetical protein [Treponemataceae bacterium]